MVANIWLLTVAAECYASIMLSVSHVLHTGLGLFIFFCWKQLPAVVRIKVNEFWAVKTQNNELKDAKKQSLVIILCGSCL